MSLTAYVWALRAVTLLAALAFGGVVLFLDPDEVGSFAEKLFWFLAGLVLFGIGLLFFTGASRVLFGEERTLLHLGATYRASLGVLVSLATGFWLWKFGLLFWWSGGLLIAGLLILELGYRSMWVTTVSETEDKEGAE